MAEDVVTPAGAGSGSPDEIRTSGYRPELRRTLGGFAVFAFISVAVGIFATYGSVLTTAGPVGIWLWIVAAVGQTLIALVVAQFAARIALSGSSYQWASRLANPRGPSSRAATSAASSTDSPRPMLIRWESGLIAASTSAGGRVIR